MQGIFYKGYWSGLYKLAMLTLTQQGLDIQILILSISLIVSLLSSKLLQRVLLRKIPAESKEGWIAHKAAPELLSPILVLLLIPVAISVISMQTSPSKPFIAGFTKIVLAWLSSRMLLLLARRHFIAYVIGTVIIGMTLLNVTNLLPPTVAFLEDITLDTATIHVSLLGIIKGIFTLIFLFWGAGVLSKGGETWIRSLNFSFNARELSIKFMRITLYFTATVMTLNQMGVDLTAFTIFGGALGVGLGFGLQKITSNFISGIILLFERTIVAGDLIEVGTEKGWVRQMAIRHTLIETFDGREMLIPNEELITGKVTNWTYTNTRARAEILLTVTYDNDVEKVIEILLVAAKQHRLALTNPAPMCFLKEFAERGVQLSLVFWIADVKSGLGAARSDVMRTIVQSFRNAGIAFAVLK